MGMAGGDCIFCEHYQVGLGQIELLVQEYFADHYALMRLDDDGARVPEPRSAQLLDWMRQ